MTDTLRQDLRYAARMLAKSPAVTGLAVLALAVGLGANAALFSVVDAVVFRPYPFQDQDRLVMLWESDPERKQPFVEVSYPDFLDWRERNTVFSGLAAMPAVNQGFTWSGNQAPVRVQGRLVSGSFFDVLGVRAALGRTFLPDDDRPGSRRVVVVGHGFWQRALGSDPGVIGRSPTLNGEASTVVGVMSPEFRYPPGAEVWVPVVPAIPQVVENRGVCWSVVLARLKDGVSPESAGAEMDGIVAALARTHRPGFGAGSRAVVTPLVDQLLGDARRTLLVLLAAVGLVLLMACVNVAALLLARATSRQREIAVRLALGSGRRRIISQLLTESALLVALGTGAGLLAAGWGLDLFLSLVPADVPRLRDVSLDRRSFAFTFVLGLLATFVSGLAPALRATRPTLTGALTGGTRGASEGPGGRGARGLLVACEVAVAVVVLAGAALVGRSFLNLSRVDLGYDTEGVLTMEVTPSGSRHPTIEAKREFQRRLIERVEALPGVRSAASVFLRPLWGTVGLDWHFTVEGQTPEEATRNPLLNLEAVTPGYFRTMGIRSLQGRDFDDRDADGAPGVVIVSQALARRYWPGQDAVGKRLKIPLPQTRYHLAWLEVVGVVADARYREMQAARLDLYISHLQFDSSLHHLVARIEGEPTGVVPLIRSEVAAQDPDQPIGDAVTMDQLVRGAMAGPRFSTQLFSVFAAMALSLAAVGIYGVIAYSVERRTREIGVRVALGAQARDVVRLVVAQGMTPTLAGLGVGLACALALSRFVSGMLYGIAATDPATLAGVAAFLALLALAASYLPARRAARVDPVEALRYE